MCSIIRSKIVLDSILFADGVNVVGACRVQVEVLDANGLGSGDGRISPVLEVLFDLIAVKVTASEGGDKDLHSSSAQTQSGNCQMESYGSPAGPLDIGGNGLKVRRELGQGKALLVVVAKLNSHDWFIVGGVGLDTFNKIVPSSIGFPGDGGGSAHGPVLTFGWILQVG